MPGELTSALAEIKTLAFTGFGLLEGISDEIFWWVQGIAVCVMFFAYFMRPAASPVDAFAPWVGLLVGMNLIAAIMGILPGFSGSWIDFMQSVGFYAGGGSGTEDLQDVSGIIDEGINASAALIQALFSINVLFNPGDFVILLCLVAVIILVHCLLAYRLIKLFGEYYILSVIALCCFPFALWRHTTFIMEGAARYILSAGVSVAAIAFGYQLMHSMVGNIVFDKTAEISTYLGQVSAMAIMLVLVASIHEGIRHFMTGSASTSFGGEARNMFFAASAGASAVRAGMVFGGAMNGAAGTAARGAMNSIPSGITLNSGFGGSGNSGGRGWAGGIATLSGPPHQTGGSNP